MARPENASAMYTTAVVLALCCAAEARNLLGSGDVKSKGTVHLDYNGGVDPLYKRIEKVLSDMYPTQELILAEKHCKAHKYEDCEEVKKLLKEKEEKEKEEPEEVEVKCYKQHPLGTWTCIKPDESNGWGATYKVPKKDEKKKP